MNRGEGLMLYRYLVQFRVGDRELDAEVITCHILDPKSEILSMLKQKLAGFTGRLFSEEEYGDVEVRGYELPRRWSISDY